MLARILEGYMHQYPHTLEDKYVRVFNNIMSTWGTPDCDKIFEDLFFDNRGGRQGFPPDVMHDILFMSRLHDKLRHVKLGRKDEDVWGNVEWKERMEKECNIEFSPRGFFWATEKGNEKAIGLFLEAGADVNLRNQFSWTPLMVATFMGSEGSANKLINAGANVSVRDKRGYAPLHWAVQRGFARVAELLVQKGAYVDVRSLKGITPLYQAAAFGRNNIARMLIAHRASVNAADQEGFTPLHKAVANKNLEIIRLLRDNHADPYAEHSKTGATPISIATASKDPDVIAATKG
jgi:ankyrin repeat protein